MKENHHPHQFVCFFLKKKKTLEGSREGGGQLTDDSSSTFQVHQEVGLVYHPASRFWSFHRVVGLWMEEGSSVQEKEIYDVIDHQIWNHAHIHPSGEVHPRPHTLRIQEYSHQVLGIENDQVQSIFDPTSQESYSPFQRQAMISSRRYSELRERSVIWWWR